MNRRQIDRFFKTLDTEFNEHARIILTGAGAGTILGSNGPSMDIDFAVELRNPDETNWKRLDSAIRNAVDETGIQANYAEDIDRWGMITLLDYRSNTMPYKEYGKLVLEVLNPAYWSIGKMTRFIDPDIQDMIQVFRKQKIPPERLTEVWGKALRESPRSKSLTRFRLRVESFLASYGTKIWGRSFNSTKAIRRFHKAAGIR